MSEGLAPGEIIIAIGSPGATRSNTNTTTATPTSVPRAMPNRLRTARAIIGASPSSSIAHGRKVDTCRGKSCRGRVSRLRPAFTSGDRHERRLQRARHVRRHLEISFVHYRLDIL